MFPPPEIDDTTTKDTTTVEKNESKQKAPKIKIKEQVTKIMNSPDGREFRSLYKKAAKSGAVIDRKKFIFLQNKVNDALRKAQMYAEKRIQNRGSVQEKTYYNERIKKATERGDIDEILLLQKEAAR